MSPYAHNHGRGKVMLPKMETSIHPLIMFVPSYKNVFSIAYSIIYCIRFEERIV